ncbi:MAG: 6-phosphogluconolactonase [Saprospiraceae bacterium]
MPPHIAIDIKRYPTRLAASTALAAQTAASLQAAIVQHGHASIVLTGGSSPSDLYAAWASNHSTDVDWQNVHFFWGDERNVQHDHIDSNMVLAKAMLNTLNIPSANIHGWRTELTPTAALQDMRKVLISLDMLRTHSFTISLFGMGEDGHVASLFPPHAPWTDFDDQFPAIARFISDSPKPPSERYTFTLPLINKSSEIYLLPFGQNKAGVIQQLIDQDRSITATWLKGQQVTQIWTDVPA